MTDKMREEFEAWQMRNMVGSGISEVFAKSSLSRDSEGVYSPIIGFAWSVWQASRAVQVVELPETEWFGAVDPEPALCERKTIAAIEAAGVRVKQ